MITEMQRAWDGGQHWIATHAGWVLGAVLVIAVVQSVRSMMAPDRWRLQRALTVAVLLLVQGRRLAFDPRDGEALYRDAGADDWRPVPWVLARELPAAGSGDLWVAEEPYEDDLDHLDGHDDAEVPEPCVAYMTDDGLDELATERASAGPGAWESIRESVGV